MYLLDIYGIKCRYQHEEITYYGDGCRASSSWLLRGYGGKLLRLPLVGFTLLVTQLSWYGGHLDACKSDFTSLKGKKKNISIRDPVTMEESSCQDPIGYLLPILASFVYKRHFHTKSGND